jgi:membrane fusion protein (multidrug efflux system)
VVLNTVSRIDPIRVRVTLSENDYLKFTRRRLQQQKDNSRTAQGGEQLELVLADGSIHEHFGRIVAVDSQVNPATGTLTLEASFPNPSHLVRPGQFGKLRFVSEIVKNAHIVWQRAVQETQGIYRVYVVMPQGEVTVKQVEPGEKLQGMWIIKKGLSSDDRVIVEGMQRVRPGMVVDPLPPEKLGVIPPNSNLLD